MMRKITENKPLKILGFTDTHIDDWPGCHHMTIKLMRETIETEKPDMVVFVGDNVTGGDNRARAEEFTQVMTELNIPWAPVLGNHEGDNPLSVSREEMMRIFMTSPCCLMPSVKIYLPDGTEVWGHGNYSVPIYSEDGKLCHRFVFMDGGAYMAREDMVRFGMNAEDDPPYDYIKENQIEWYRREVGNDECPSTVFCHIPLPEYEDAIKYGEHISGINYEGICCSTYNSGMFDAMLTEGKTKLFVCGHDHINDSRYLYKGIYLMYNRMGGMSSYNTISTRRTDRLLKGCSVYYVHADGSIAFDDILYEERYPEYRDDIYAVIRTPDKKSS